MSTIRCLLLVVYLSHAATPSQRLFAADFRAPDPPISIIAAYKGSFIQHKWDATGISHIASGMIYANPTIGRLRMDLTYEGVIASSLFDYASANSDGTIPNYIYTFAPTTATQGACTYYNVTPAYPLFPPNILQAYGATFVGLITDNLFYADQPALEAWAVLFGATTSATVYLDANQTLVRIDFSSPVRGTFTTTRLFNIAPGAPSPNLFVNPCPGETPPAVTSDGTSPAVTSDGTSPAVTSDGTPPPVTSGGVRSV
ncbi:unnamed protein product [Didymodactylos carnosus]|uniref:Uncharacterized protein n=1 Tax=Didymodactylos carnosus TaxID=1234261 RepID=A0A8S2PUQ5_9BILA|nr:unnamed protein product [Didymodactylos carnosus]CAF4066918.1 unnamed protein product [Didymodactylos carnosus]